MPNNVLKPGGVVGVVQHHARDHMPDEWADGNAGYLKDDFVIAKMEAVGFELVDSSDLNANDKDQPTTEDVVWRLPPSLSGGADDPERAAAMRAHWRVKSHDAQVQKAGLLGADLERNTARGAQDGIAGRFFCLTVR